MYEIVLHGIFNRIISRILVWFVLVKIITCMNTMVNNKRFLAHYVEGAVAKKKISAK